jgi:AcrR family transcriptional regulator
MMNSPDLAPERTTALRSRDADGTRQALLDAARRRFARDGYSSTTVRDIAQDAGVNVALISRYFDSKEGLFEACLTHTAKEMGRERPDDITVDKLVQSILRRVTDAPEGELTLQLLLLLRSSGDERADGIRRSTIEQFAERMASAGRPAGDGYTHDQAVLRAQLVMATALGMTLLRASSGVEPLSSAKTDDLLAPLSEMVEALLVTVPPA